jgi:hypothetical protein
MADTECRTESAFIPPSKLLSGRASRIHNRARKGFPLAASPDDPRRDLLGLIFPSPVVP